MRSGRTFDAECRDPDQVDVVIALRLPMGVYRVIERHALAGNPKPAELMRRWVAEGLARDTAPQAATLPSGCGRPDDGFAGSSKPRGEYR